MLTVAFPQTRRTRTFVEDGGALQRNNREREREAKEQGNTHFKAKEYLKAAASLHAESAVATVAQRVTLVAWGRGFGI